MTSNGSGRSSFSRSRNTRTSPKTTRPTSSSRQSSPGIRSRNLPSGTSEGVESLTVEQLHRYWRERLVGPNVLVSVVSGMPHEEIAGRLTVALKDLPAGPVPAVNYRDVPNSAPSNVDLPLGSDQSHIFVGGPIPGVASEDRAPLRVLNAVLGRSSGRLFTEIRDKRGLAYNLLISRSSSMAASSTSTPARRPGPPTRCSLWCRPSSSESAMSRSAPSSCRTPSAVRSARGRMAVETSANEALYTARDTMFGIPPREIQAAATRAVTAADVQRVARTYLDPTRLSVVMTRPTGLTDAQVIR